MLRSVLGCRFGGASASFGRAAALFAAAGAVLFLAGQSPASAEYVDHMRVGSITAVNVIENVTTPPGEKLTVRVDLSDQTMFVYMSEKLVHTFKVSTARKGYITPIGRYQAMAVSPISSGRLNPPDIVLFYATPGAMMYFINGLQWAGYKRFDWSVVGESACADSWGRALSTRQPSLSIPCFAERRYGGVLDDEMLMAIPPEYLPKALAGMAALGGNGLRYPFPQYGIQMDVRDGMAASYPDRARK